MIRVTAPSRLHFGLFRLPAEQEGFWPDLGGHLTVPARHFGGVGLMIDKPGVQLSVDPATTWFAEGPLAERALRFAQQFALSLAFANKQAFHLEVVGCAPEHIGLGTGTQLGLAVSRALARALHLPELGAVALARHIGRGARSGLGIHGFEQGGFLVDGGKAATTAIAPLVARVAFPEDWRILLVLPENLKGTHGEREREAFARLAGNDLDSKRTDVLCRLVLLGMLPALIENDLPAFGEALYDFNRRVGEMFRPWQGGIYSEETTVSLIRVFRELKIHAVGQSSWGPVTFAIVQDTAQALEVGDWLCRKERIAPERVLVTSASKSGAAIFQS